MTYSTILVTGGAGFIGSNLVKSLLNDSVRILNVDKLTYAGNLENLEEYQDHPQHQFFKVDICDTKSIQAILDEFKPEAVIHLAAESHVDRSIDDASTFIETNINGTYSLIKNSYNYYKNLFGAQKESFRFIHISTDEVFGALGQEGKFTEESPYKPNSPYAASKAASDLLVRSYFKTFHFPAIIVNASNNYGPCQFPEKLIPLIILNALEEKNLPVYGNGKQVRDWLNVQDHVRAIKKILNNGKVGESYCVGADSEIENIEIIRKICLILDELYPRSNERSYFDLVQFVTDRPGHDFRYATDACKLRAQTGWKPEVSFDQGLRDTILWYLNKRDVFKEKKFDHRLGLG